MKELDTEIKKARKSVGDSRPDVGNYGKVWENVSKGWFAVTGVIAGITAIVAGFVKFNNEIVKSNKRLRTVKRLFDLTGESAHKFSVELNAIANSLNVDFKDVARNVNVLAEEFELTNDEATKLLEKGLLMSDNADEFLEQVREYSTQFAGAGGEAKKFIALLVETERRGIYNDKGIDAIKEANLRLKEGNTATEDALYALEEKARLEIQSLARQGKTIDAIKAVSRELNKGYLNAQQFQTVVADVFGSAGEDAGEKFLLSLQDINLEIDSLEDGLTSNERAGIELNKQWSIMYDNLIGNSSALSSFTTSFKNFAYRS